MKKPEMVDSITRVKVYKRWHLIKFFAYTCAEKFRFPSFADTLKKRAKKGTPRVELTVIGGEPRLGLYDEKGNVIRKAP